jgi:two-component system chemotaxis response regulator CheB
MEAVKVLIVDDSLIYRKLIENVLLSIDNIQVIGSMWNGKKAIEFLNNNPNNLPNIITLDVEMPEMNGLETLKEIKIFNSKLALSKKIQVIMVSSLTQTGAKITFDAIELGAMDYILKPQRANSDQNFYELQISLKEKISIISGLNINKTTNLTTKNTSIKDFTDKKILPKNINAIVIGISTGGPKAMLDILPEICEKTDLPIIIVQHMPKEFTKSYAENLNKKCIHNVTEAENFMTIKKSNVYIAPGGFHLYIKKNENNASYLTLTDNPPENNCKPSVDVLFRSAADVYGNKLLAIIMTGMGNDGAKSMMALKRAGAVIIAQDKESSVVWGMPESAIQTGCVDYVVSLNKIAEIIKQIVNKM